MMELIHKSIRILPEDLVMIKREVFSIKLQPGIMSKKILKVKKTEREKDFINIFGTIIYEESIGEPFLDMMTMIGEGNDYVFRFFYRGKGFEKAYKISKEEYLIEVV